MGFIVFFVMVSMITGLKFTTTYTIFIQPEKNTSYNSIIGNSAISINLSSNLVPFDPISIIGDSELQQAVYNNGWPGTGYVNDPYIISNYLIDNDTSIGIYLEAITYYFVIENVAINGSLGAGIYIKFCDHSVIKDSFITNVTNDAGFNNGITLEYTYMMTIQNTTFLNNNIGINISQTSGLTIINNILYNSTTTGIDGSIQDIVKDNSYIAGNKVFYSNVGYNFNFWSGINNTLENNLAHNNTVGFEITFSVVLKDNKASNNSLYGFNLTFADTSVVENNTATGNGLSGFYFQDTVGVEFTKNKANNNLYYGLSGTNSYALNIINNEFSDNYEDGILMPDLASDCIIQNNTIANNLVGIDAPDINANIIVNNLFLNNLYYGMIASYSVQNYIAFNEFKTSGQFGLLISSSSFNNTIKANYFINNSVNAQDNTISKNQWQGNYFSDYNGSIYYSIPGTALSIDTLPRALDSDADGLPDYYEKLYGFNVLVNDSYLDPDNDGLTNYQEFLSGTNPLVPDIIVTTTSTATSTVTETAPPIYITSNFTTITTNTSVSTLLTLFTNSGNSNGNDIPLSNSLPGYELLFVVVALGIVILARKRS